MLTNLSEFIKFYEAEEEAIKNLKSILKKALKTYQLNKNNNNIRIHTIWSNQENLLINRRLSFAQASITNFLFCGPNCFLLFDFVNSVVYIHKIYT